jgi:endoglycosylceramidase
MHLRPVVVGLVTGLAACTAQPADDPPGSRPEPLFRVEGGAIATGDGEVVFLRGINLSQESKDEPFLYPLELEDAGRMLAHGFNTVRFLTVWEAVMPRGPHAIDDRYLEDVVAQVWALESMGLFVVMDMHQDLWGPPFGDGAPEWACPEEVRAGYEPQSPWWRNYSSPQVTGCFDRFWSDEALQDRFIEAWTAVASAVCSHDNVVGFDLLNEPWPGTAFGSPSFENDVLYPFYLRAMDAIETVCPGRVYFLEPLFTYSLGLSDPIELPDAVRDRVVMSPHYYPPEVHEPGVGYQGDAGTLEAAVLALLDDMLDQGYPVWIGEWGGLTDNPGFDAYVRDASDVFLRHFVGSALWEYSEGATGFSLLDREGDERQVYRSLREVPTPTRVPAVPDVIVPRNDDAALELRFRCSPDRRVSIVIPGRGEASCRAEPEAGLYVVPALPGFFDAHCVAGGDVTLTCRAE